MKEVGGEAFYVIEPGAKFIIQRTFPNRVWSALALLDDLGPGDIIDDWGWMKTASLMSTVHKGRA